MDWINIVVFFSVYFTGMNCYNISTRKEYSDRPKYEYNDEVKLIYSLPDSNITLTCERFTENTGINGIPSFYTASFGRRLTMMSRSRLASVGRLFRVYGDLTNLPVRKINVNNSQQMSIRKAIPTVHAGTYPCVGMGTMNVKETVILDIFQSPFTLPLITTDIDRYNKILPCEIELDDYGWEQFMWIRFPNVNNTDTYELISINDRITRNVRSNYEIANVCDLSFNSNIRGFYVFRAIYNTGRFKMYHTLLYKPVYPRNV